MVSYSCNCRAILSCTSQVVFPDASEIANVTIFKALNTSLANAKVSVWQQCI